MPVKKKTKKPARGPGVLPAETSPEEIDKALEALDDDVLEVDGIDIVEVPPDEPTPMTLTKDEMLKLQLAQYQSRAFEAERALEMIKKDVYLKQIDPENKLQQMMAFIRGRTDEAVKAKQDHEAITKQIEERLKIKLSEYAYDDETGILQRVDQ